MNKKIIFHKPENKRLVITSDHKNLIAVTQNQEARKPILSHNSFHKQIIHNTQEKRVLKPNSDDLANQNPINTPKHACFENQIEKNTDKKEYRVNHFKKKQIVRSVKIERALSCNPIENKTCRAKKLACIPHHSTNDKKSIFYMNVDQIYNVLNESLNLQAKNHASITLRKQLFYQIFISLLESLRQNHEYLEQSLGKSIFELLEIFQDIKSKVKSDEIQRKSLKLQSKSRAFSCILYPPDYQFEVKKINEDLFNLSQKQQQLDDKINSKKLELNTIIDLCKEKQQLKTQMERKTSEYSDLYNTQTNKLQQINRQVAQKTQFLKNIEQKVTKLLSFVQTQEEKKVLQWVSEAYKQIQAQIYDYASYLQCNAMASSLIWEPKPFRAVQKWVYEEMERVNSYLMSAETVESKAAKMKDFVSNTTRKFKNKDEQMMKIVDFKTECIKKFIKMMEKWLENWQLKQEYLVNLRKEFVVQSEQIEELINKLKANLGQFDQSSYTKDSPFVVDCIQKIQSLWRKVELNYKYGNSFY